MLRGHAQVRGARAGLPACQGSTLCEATRLLCMLRRVESHRWRCRRRLLVVPSEQQKRPDHLLDINKADPRP